MLSLFVNKCQVLQDISFTKSAGNEKIRLYFVTSFYTIDKNINVINT